MGTREVRPPNLLSRKLARLATCLCVVGTFVVALPEQSALAYNAAKYADDPYASGHMAYVNAGQNYTNDYNWQGDGHKDHVGIQVGWGTDPTSGWYGNYQDQHTNNR
jgi:hypothetical protein